MTDFKIHRIAPKIAPKALGIQDYDVEHLDLTGRIELLKKVDQGGFSDIWLGRLRNKDGNTFEVAVKELRMQGKPLNRSYKALLRDRFCQEVVLWSKLCHPNIVPLLGYIVTVDKETAFPGLISPWYNKGDVVNYLKANPEANRKQFLLDVVSALQYLHGLAFIHGDIKGGNVLIDMNDKACLCDFGMSKLHKDVEELTDYVGTRGTPRFTAPEVLNSSHSTTMSDIWSFGCLAIQIMLDQLPYQHKKTKFSVHEANLAGKPPLLVRDIVRNPAEELFWHQIQQCWNVDATKRPTAEKLVTEISNLITASPVVNLDITKNVILGELIAQDQHWETRSAKLMTEISTTTVVVRAYGGYDSQITIDIQKELCEKISCWSSMRHLNVTPTVGYILEPSNLALPSIVLPPDVEQSIDELLSSTSDANKFQLLLDVARGLNYLHHIGVVHGDIRPCNIYVGVNGTASLGGYWTSSYTEITETDPDFALDKSDSLRFTSPEILYHQKKTATTDIWAIGCLAIKILINYTPYKEIDDTEQLEAAIKSGQRPIPAQYKISNLPHIHLWGCIKQCWSHDPSQRPRVTELVAALADVETLPHVETFDLSKSLQVGARVFQGVNSDLHKGLLKPNNVNVAVKLLRRFYREILTWSQLEHPNVVPLFGFAVISDVCPALVSPWIENGSVSSYLQRHPTADRLLLLLDILHGLEFLHQMGLMHGDLKADNVLVDSSGKASLADFGMSAFMDTMRQLSGFSTESNFCGNLRFASPETLMEDEKSLATDVWAFACMVIQIMKNHPPYHHIKDDRVVPSRIINGEPPWVGEESIFPASDPQLWNEIKLCWSYEPASRPDARRLLLRVREHFYIRPHSVPLPLKWDSELPILTEYIVKSGYVASSASSETFFGYLELGGTTSTHRLSSILRHLGDIEGGKNSKVKVAIKEVRMTSQYGGGNLLWARRSIKLLLREDIDWDQMIHPNIVPLLGYTWEADSNCCLITPWYANGDIVNYLKLHPTVNRLLLTLDIAEGLTYIHAVGLVHGVVKGANVLVNDYGRAKLCDIGLTHLLTRDNQRILLSDPASRMRWMAHEILKKEQLPTAYSDVWSFGCVVMEVMLDIMPYPRLGGWVELQTAITNGLQPLEWSDCPSSEADQHFWEHIYRCWESDPFRRPLMRDMVAMIKQQLALSSGSTLSMSSLNANTQPGTETR